MTTQTEEEAILEAYLEDDSSKLSERLRLADGADLPDYRVIDAVFGITPTPTTIRTEEPSYEVR